MKVDSLINLVFSEDEVREALVLLMDCKRNDLLHTDPEHKRLSRIINHVQCHQVSMDWTTEGFAVSVDGIHTSDDLDLLVDSK